MQVNKFIQLQNKKALGEVFNIACNKRTSLIELFHLLKTKISKFFPNINIKPEYRDFLPGDIRLSHANIEKAINLLNYNPEKMISEGLDKTISWYISSLTKQQN